MIRNKRIANPSSKSSPIDRRTSHHREEDNPLRDESPPPESSRKVAVFPLRRVTAARDDSTTHFIDLYTSREDLEIAHVIFNEKKHGKDWSILKEGDSY
ncbi:unnamed protein product [Spirodela intermedia]|uniref:Uncharacterized protein n=1 Tax=Spirodela intermedia TaxID=51605 RepID=A0ABN7E954_SPIIN|nr:unnamed protein product [Spirodela intermedia]